MLQFILNYFSRCAAPGAFIQTDPIAPTSEQAIDASLQFLFPAAFCGDNENDD